MAVRNGSERNTAGLPHAVVPREFIVYRDDMTHAYKYPGTLVPTGLDGSVWGVLETTDSAARAEGTARLAVCLAHNDHMRPIDTA